MDLLSLLLLFCAGSVAGFLAGFFGIGGGILLVPILLYAYHDAGVSSLIATHLAFGTSLLVAFWTAIASTFQYGRQGFVLWRAVLFLGAGGLVGAFLGAVFAGGLDARTLRAIFAVLVVVTAVRLLTNARKPKGEPSDELLWLKLLAAGFFTGLVAALAGVGGGVLAIPVLYSFLRFPLKRALGTSSVTVVIISLAAAAGYAVEGWHAQGLPAHAAGYLDLLRAVPLILGSVPFALLGAWTAERTTTATLKKVFAILLVAIAAKMFLG